MLGTSKAQSQLLPAHFNLDFHSDFGIGIEHIEALQKKSLKALDNRYEDIYSDYKGKVPLEVVVEAVGPIRHHQKLSPLKPGWKGQPDQDHCETIYSLEELVSKFNMRVVPWDGQESHLIVDVDGIFMGILDPIPKDESWKDICHLAVAAIEET
ncbi:hypothetical protein BYT27DRAFT_7209926 [Phlegmacium glaucopus]|nr:hypothetical protein BYT27DRAFT_7209926 [Phlegmacium glaucopus]